MSVYMISYDLNKPGRNYDELYNTIKSYVEYHRFLDSAWFIETHKTAQEISDSIKKTIDDNDSLLVNRVTKEFAGWLPQDTWTWLTNHLT